MVCRMMVFGRDCCLITAVSNDNSCLVLLFVVLCVFCLKLLFFCFLCLCLSLVPLRYPFNRYNNVNRTIFRRNPFVKYSSFSDHIIILISFYN